MFVRSVDVALRLKTVSTRFTLRVTAGLGASGGGEVWQSRSLLAGGRGGCYGTSDRPGHGPALHARHRGARTGLCQRRGSAELLKRNKKISLIDCVAKNIINCCE